MIAVIIGIVSGLLVILTIGLFKRLDKTMIYGLILSGIGFLYAGFTWADWKALAINAVQATFFLLLSYFGIKKSIEFLIAGYFLHGSWDLAYSLFQDSNLIPPHYDLFCLSIDFTMGFYLLLLKYMVRHKSLQCKI
ncbi:MAG: DUF6010 family protein [Ferruginibacter sp.]